MANAQRIRHVAKIINTYRKKRPIVVLSALGDTTDLLLAAAENAVNGIVSIEAVAKLHRETARALGIEAQRLELLLEELAQLLTGISMLKELTKRTRDYLVSFGERLSVRVMAAHLCNEGIPAQFYDAWDIGIASDNNFMAAELLDSVWEAIPARLHAYCSGGQQAIPIVTGFIAKDSDGHITTLGRGGSDLTATIIGAALRVEEIQTWKDVDGIMTTDPRICSDAKLVAEVTYEEAEELALFGSQVLHPRSMLPCRKTGTVVRVKNSYNIESSGTIIVEKRSGNIPPVCAITNVKNVTLIDIVSTRMLGAAGFLAHIFNQFLKWNVSVDVVATSEVSVSLTVNGDVALEGLLKDMSAVADVRTHAGKSIVSVICDVARSSSILAKGFNALADAKINVQMISQGASKVNISMIVDDADSERTVKVLHSAYFG